MKEIFLDFLEVSASMAAVTALVIILSPIIDKRFSANWKYWVWLFIAARLIIPYSPDFDFAAEKMKVSVPDKVVYYRAEEVPGEPVPGKSSNVTTPSGTFSVVTTPNPMVTIETRRTVLDIFGIIWASGSGLFVIWYMGGYFYFRKKQLEGSRPAEEKIAKNVSEAKNSLGISRNFETLVSENITSPMIMGFISPKLVLPAEEYDPEELAFILRHELTHYKRHDTLYKALLLFVNALHWFNPMVWVMRNLAGTDLELSCDSAVVDREETDIRVKYSKTILACVHRESTACTVFSTHFYGGAKTLKKRFANILNTEKRKSGALAFAAVLILASALGGFAACGAVYDEPSEKELKSLLQKADSFYQRNDYGLFKTKQNTVVFHENNAYILVDDYDSVVSGIFTEKAIEKIENTKTEEGLPLYINLKGEVYKLRGENPMLITAKTHYSIIHWIKLISIENNRFTYDVCHSGTELVTTRSRIVVVNEKGKFLLDEFDSHMDYIIPEDFAQTEEKSEEGSEVVPVVPENTADENNGKVTTFLKNYPDPLKAIANLSNLHPKDYPIEEAKNLEEREILGFLYTYYSSFATLEEPDFSGFLNGGGDFTLAEQVLRCNAAKQRINKTFWKDFELDTEVISRRGKAGLGIVSYEIKCTFSATDNYGKKVSGTDYWDINLASKAFSKIAYMKEFYPSSKYASDSGYYETLSELTETANRFPEYKWDYRKLADCIIAEYYLGLRE